MTKQKLTKNRKKVEKILEKYSMCLTRELDQWIIDCEKNILFYQGDQYTIEEKRDLAEKAAFDEPLNIIRAYLRQVISLFNREKPSIKAVPVGDKDVSLSNAINIVFKHIWQENNADIEYLLAIQDMVIANKGYLYTHIDYDPYGNKKINISSVPFYRVVVDPASQKVLHEDASYIFLVSTMAIDEAVRIFGGKKSDYEPYDERPELRRIGREAQMSSPIFTGEMYDDENNYVKVIEKFTYHYPENSNKRKVKREIVVGYNYIGEEILDLTHYPIVPFVDEFSRNPYSTGEVHYLKPQQRLYNKLAAVILKSIQTNSMARKYWPKTSTKMTESELDRKTSIPGKNIILSSEQPPIFEPNVGLQTDIFKFFEILQNNFVATINPGELDQSTTNTSVQDGFFRLQEQRKKISGLSKNIGAAIKRIAELVYQQVPKVYKKNDILSFVDDTIVETADLSEEKYYLTEEFLANVPDDVYAEIQEIVKVGRQDGLSQKQVLEMVVRTLKQLGIEPPALSIFSIIKNMKFNIACDVSLSGATERELQQYRLAELARNGVVDPQIAFMELDLGIDRDIKEKFDVISNLNAKVEMLEKENNQLKAENEQRLNESNFKDASIMKEKANLNMKENDLKALLREIRLQEKYGTDAIKIKEDVMKKQINIAVKEAMLKIEEKLLKEKREAKNDK